MRLLNTRNGFFQWINDPQAGQVRYAILSHVWSPDGEQTFQALRRIQTRVEADESGGTEAVLQHVSSKIRMACAVAAQDGYDFIWIDSCCIDKTNHVELSEAINSMYTWYGQAAICYAFLHDVDGDENPYLPNSGFRKSQWYTRGWTLQELIAPVHITFMSSRWSSLGTKSSLSYLIQEITGVDEDILAHLRPLGSVSVARRMSWAATRSTTKEEDVAYCLMGIFGLHIPIIYGEGQGAFIRLQEEILKHIPDQSIFVWKRFGHHDLDGFSLRPARPDTLLAPSPKFFISSGEILCIPPSELEHQIGVPIRPSPYIIMSSGLRATFPLVSFGPLVLLAVLACKDRNGYLVCLVLKRTFNRRVYAVGLTVFHDSMSPMQWDLDIITTHDHHTTHVMSALPSAIRHLDVSVADVDIVYRPEPKMPSHIHTTSGPSSDDRVTLYTIALSGWCNSRLAQLGFTAHLLCEDSGTWWPTYVLSVVGRSGSYRARICYAYMCDDGPWSLAVHVRLISPIDSELLPPSEANRLEDVPNHEHKSCVNPEHVHAWDTLGSDYARSRCFRAEADQALRTEWKPEGTDLQLTLSYAPGPEDALPRVYHLSVEVNHNSLVKLMDYRAAPSIQVLDARSTTADLGLSKIVDLSKRVTNASVIAAPHSKHIDDSHQERFDYISDQFHILDLPHRTMTFRDFSSSVTGLQLGCFSTPSAPAHRFGCISLQDALDRRYDDCLENDEFTSLPEPSDYGCLCVENGPKTLLRVKIHGCGGMSRRNAAVVDCFREGPGRKIVLPPRGEFASHIAKQVKEMMEGRTLRYGEEEIDWNLGQLVLLGITHVGPIYVNAVLAIRR